MARLKSIVNVGDLKKALNSLPAAEAERGVPFRGIRGTLLEEPVLAGGIFIGTHMLRGFANQKKTFATSHVFEGSITRSTKNPKTRFVLAAKSALPVVKEVTRQCLLQAKLKYEFVVIKFGGQEPE